MKEIWEEYKSAKKALLSEQSKYNYKNLLDACYRMLFYHPELCRKGEFAGTLQVYEKAALSFWKQYRTAESLCHVVYFYGDWKILEYFKSLPERKRHLRKGLEYAKQYHDMEDADYSACLYIQYYVSLCETCRSGESEEQLSYAKTAYNLAKQYLKKYRTEQIFEEYKFVVMAFACHCRMSGKEKPAAEAERECEKLSDAFRKNRFQSGQAEPIRNDVPFIPEKIVECAVRNADFVVKSRREEVSAALDQVTFMREKRKARGLLSLEEAIADIKVRNTPCAEFLSGQIILMIDLLDAELMTEIMTNEFWVRQPDDFEAFILYIYMLALIMIWLESKYESVWCREGAWKELVRLRNKYIRFLPEVCKKVFQTP